MADTTDKEEEVQKTIEAYKKVWTQEAFSNLSTVNKWPVNIKTQYLKGKKVLSLRSLAFSDDLHKEHSNNCNSKRIFRFVTLLKQRT